MCTKIWTSLVGCVEGVHLPDTPCHHLGYDSDNSGQTWDTAQSNILVFGAVSYGAVYYPIRKSLYHLKWLLSTTECVSVTAVNTRLTATPHLLLLFPKNIRLIPYATYLLCCIAFHVVVACCNCHYKQCSLHSQQFILHTVIVSQLRKHFIQDYWKSMQESWRWS